MARRNNPDDPEQWLDDRIAEQLTPALEGGQLISATEQGKTASFAIPDGMSHAELMGILESAIKTLNGGGQIAYIRTRFQRPT